MHQDYPFFLPNHSAQQAIRLRLAALLACLDGGVAYPPHEVLPYRLADDPNETSVHAFAWTSPSGKLAEHIAEVMQSLCRSIVRKDLQPLLIVMDIDDEIDPANTWISATDFQHWCTQRTIDLGELWDRFLDEAYYIESSAMQAASRELEELESSKSNYVKQAVDSSLEEQDWYACLSPELQGKIDGHLSQLLLSCLRSLGIPDTEPKNVGARGTETDRALQPRERTTLLNIIGALLEANGTKEAALIAQLEEKYPTVSGIKKRTLEGKFALGKRSLTAN